MKKPSAKSSPFGLHLLLEAYDCDEKTLDSERLVRKILSDLPIQIGMRKLAEPHVLKAAPNGKRDPGGWTGFVLIHESHISLHTFIKRGFVTADVYSCKEFDAMKAVDYFRKSFKTKDVQYAIIQRGIKYPPENKM